MGGEEGKRERTVHNTGSEGAGEESKRRLYKAWGVGSFLTAVTLIYSQNVGCNSILAFG